MNLNSIADGATPANNLTFSYDDAGRLNGSTGPYGARGYTYDKEGSRLTEVLYEPSGTVHSIVGIAANDNRLPGQLFQLETGLAYNWHRHYDSTLGRHTQVDPLGLTAMLNDGPSVYGYVGQSPLM